MFAELGCAVRNAQNRYHSFEKCMSDAVPRFSSLFDDMEENFNVRWWIKTALINVDRFLYDIGDIAETAQSGTCTIKLYTRVNSCYKWEISRISGS